MSTARAHSNIAFIKYWGNRNENLRLPVTGSISMNLAGLDTTTTVEFDETLADDRLLLNGEEQTGAALDRVSGHLDYIRAMAGFKQRAYVESENTFPAGAGIASSASAFAALTLAACDAAGLDLDERTLSMTARLGSGSASRSVPGGFVAWWAADRHEDSYAETIAPPEHWDLVDVVAIVSTEHKAVGSTGGHRLAPTSPLQTGRIADAERRLAACRQAILERDFEAFAEVVEHDALMMHAVMMTSQPALIYWTPDTLRLIEAARAWRADGMPVCFTIDAGPNVHLMTPAAYADSVAAMAAALPGVLSVRRADPGGPAHLLVEPR
ncbi:MAG: diphosphomevalonate decarboxylase [Chloroflexi bacterium]|nr:diphosphomevalonate decarboxylase [Chloroflexota bacterium]